MAQPAVVAMPLPVLTRDTFNSQSFGPLLNAHVKQARVLMVGAGGIGCELLKNLVLAGFAEVHIVDLDTIDLSNLNRQFLFRQEHIKKSKALVAKEAAQKFNPNVEIVAHHANIKDSEFGVEWFGEFKVVFNALDNIEARRHVNKMCLAADVPLIESGTTGFNGQVQVIKKGVTACYDCTPKDAPKSFPVCTIRSTPSQPIHCIVWGKSYLLNEIFGASEDESAFDHSADQDNAKEIEELERESKALHEIRQSIGRDEFPRMLFDKVFDKDIARLRSMEDMWKSRKPPEPLDYSSLMAKSADAIATKDSILKDGQKVWTLEENLVVFNDSLDRLSRRILDMKKASRDKPERERKSEPIIAFDKDDEDTLDFVAASANIRSSLFGIDRKSKFDIKQMAGNIIPAIATTNAIVAGLCVLESFKVLRSEYDRTKEVILTPFRPARLLAPDKSREPNPDCPVCSVFRTSAYVDLARATLNDLVEDFLKLQLGYGDRQISVSNEIGLLYDAADAEDDEDDDLAENLSKKLSEFGIKQDSFLTIRDEGIEPYVNVEVNIRAVEASLVDKPVKGISTGQIRIPLKPKKDTTLQLNGTAHENGKRARDSDPAESLPTKRAKAGGALDAKKVKIDTGEPTTADDDVVLVDDDNADGAIVIDDDD